ncbi:hypothetical protein CLCAR_2895 [Clostridium carboxidivorans P7]|nr:hypothetical protein CLCAR_2895 [Clostridium carboxidivorans P7]
MKNNYLMTQIADMIKQLYEWHYLKESEFCKSGNITKRLL